MELSISPISAGLKNGKKERKEERFLHSSVGIFRAGIFGRVSGL